MSVASITDRDLWAIALRVERDQGDDGPFHIAEKIGEAALAGEDAAVDLWKAVAVRYDQLRARPNEWNFDPILS